MKLYRRKNADGSVRSPHWWMDVTVDGTRTRRSTERERKSEAQIVMETFTKGERDRVQLGAAEEITVEAAMLRYLRSIRRKPDFANALSRARKLLGRYYVVGEKDVEVGETPASFGGFHCLRPDMMLHEVTTRTIARLKDERAAEGLAEMSINHEVKQLQRLYNLAPEWGVRRAPDVAFKKFKYRPKLRFASEAEEGRVLAELEGLIARSHNSPVHVVQQLSDQRDLVVFLLDTGARIGEACAATWDVVDTQGWQWINIYRSKVGNQGMLGMTGRLRAILQRRHAAGGLSPYLFPGYDQRTRRAIPTQHRNPASTDGIQAAIDRAGLNAAHLVSAKGRFTPHSFRDTFATRLIQNGVRIEQISKLLGHASLQMTMKYAQVDGAATAAEAAGVLDRIHARQENPVHA